MADDQPLDPAKLMRAFFAAWNQGQAPSDRPADARPGEAPAMRLMAQALAIANMPSREEVSSLAARLDRIETLLDRIDDRLSALESSRAASDESAAPVKKRGKKKR